jgi:hypothetical protein
VTHLHRVEQLRRDFNQWSDTSRVLSVLSPTCPNCLEGYRLVSQMPAGPTSLVLWTAMLDGDSSLAATDQIGECAHLIWPPPGRLVLGKVGPT